MSCAVLILYVVLLVNSYMYVIVVMVYSKICTEDIDAVGPNWYRLEVIGPAKDLGQFEKPWEYSGAVKREEVRNFLALGPNMEKLVY